jgi:serine/threonine-protein kinase/endoribonuclease IRE1
MFLYLGKKIDTWFAMDPNTGVKQEILSFNKPDKTCPLDSSDVIFIGRTGKYLGHLMDG